MKFTVTAVVDGKKCEFVCSCDDMARGELMKNQIVSMICAWSALLTDLKVESS